MAKKTAKKRGRRPSLNNFSLSDLQAELARRASELGKLVAERNELAARVDELDAQIGMLRAMQGGGPGKSVSITKTGKKRGRPVGSKNKKKSASKSASGRSRPKNSMSLADSLAKLLKNKTMGVTEIAAAVQKAGYKTNAENFRTIVNQTLIREDRFKKVSRGQYTAA